MTQRTRTRPLKAAAITGAGALLTALLTVLLGPAAPAGAATVPVDLYAVAGSTTLPGGQTVPVWGYARTDTTISAPGGPTIVVDAGDTVQITLHNQLAERTALLLQGQPMVPDLTGVAPSDSKTYSFTASSPGTYLYEAGLLPNAQHQTAMGLHGALVVRPAGSPGQAYGSASTRFDDEAVLVLSELDPALNTAADKAAFDMRRFAPRYFLINGKAYPNTDPITTTGGSTVLLRYVNAGMDYHSMQVAGADQTVIALDGNPLDFSRRYVAETFGPGQTADALVTTPASAPGDLQLTVYDGNLKLHNTNTSGIGGMLTTVDIPGSGPAAADTTGPVSSAATYNAGTLTAHIADSGRGGGDVVAAEYFVDDLTVAGTPMTGAFASPDEDATAQLTIGSGEHVVYVRGQDSQGNWGPVTSVLASGADAGGPTTTGPLLTPRLTNHANTGGVAVSATADDSSSGNSNIAAAEYFIDTPGSDGTGQTMSVNANAAVASVDGTIPAATVNGLSEGAHVIYIHAQDAPGNWGTAITVNLVIDTTAPSTSGVSVAPTPNNGTLPFTAGTSTVRLSATTMSDPVSGSVNSPIEKAEAFIDTVGANGSGIPLTASDGVFNDPAEGGYADIPLSTVKAMSNGSHTLYVHAKDAAGNWGATSSTTLLVDKVVPSVTTVSASPNPTQGTRSVTLAGTATDTATAVTRAEWFVGADPGPGSATPMTVSGSGPYTMSALVDVSTWSEGSYTLRVRVRDAAGNWSAASSTTLNVTGPLYLSTFGNSNPPGVAGTADDADIYSWNGSIYARVWDASTMGIPAAANVDGYDRVDSTHFYLSFADNTAVPGLGVVQDEDVVYYNAGVWSVFFDGTARGLTANNQDLDAINVSGGVLYFSTLGDTSPPGVAGTADDADIYSWNGSSFARAWDASANGVPAAANVDGYVRTDASHFYLSFAADTTLPGVGATQDEDVVYDGAGSWAVYFNGTGHGLTSANLDVDAFDLP